jgi:hypothetical protein
MKDNQYAHNDSADTIIARRTANGYPIPNNDNSKEESSSSSSSNTTPSNTDSDDELILRRAFCDASLMPLEQILYLPDTNKYYRVIPDDDDENDQAVMDPLNRHLGSWSRHTTSASSSYSTDIMMESSKVTLAMNPTQDVHERLLEDIVANNTSLIINAHRCWCAWQGTFYCPA